MNLTSSSALSPTKNLQVNETPTQKSRVKATVDDLKSGSETPEYLHFFFPRWEVNTMFRVPPWGNGFLDGLPCFIITEMCVGGRSGRVIRG
jgi:hypothetical protein